MYEATDEWAAWMLRNVDLEDMPCGPAAEVRLAMRAVADANMGDDQAGAVLWNAAAIIMERKA